MSIKNLWTPSELTEETVIRKGANMRKWGIRISLIGLIGIALLVLTIIIGAMMFGGEGVVMILAFQCKRGYAFVNIFTVLGYLGILAQPVAAGLYLNGLQLWTLGRIADSANVEVEEETEE